MSKAQTIINAKPRIGFTITLRGVESVLILGTGGEPEDRNAGLSLCSLLDEEINNFDAAIKRKIEETKKHGFNNMQ